MGASTMTADVYNDFNGLAQLRAKASGNKADEQQALTEVARQFETVFLKMMLKSMRDTVPESELVNSDKSRFYESMYDDQISLDLSKRGHLGLADMIVQQLGEPSTTKSVTDPNRLADYRRASITPIKGALQDTKLIEQNPKTIKSPEEFISKLWPQAQQAAQELGVDAKVLLAQSALETGWGKHVIHDKQGQNSHNLFGIKASHNWQGKTVSVQTVEYESGVASKRQALFRAYDSYEESFNDYVGFLKQNPRYQEALLKNDSNEGFVRGLQKAGYATDPAYATKILSILERDTFSQLMPSDQLKTTDISV